MSLIAGLASRVNSLEMKSGSGARMVGVQDGDELVTIHVDGSEVQMTPLEFERLYPDGLIIRIVDEVQ